MEERHMKLLKTAYAHCDIPCGIYETDSMLHDTDTCIKMIEKIEGLGELDNVEKHNTFVRCVVNKEKHADKVKHQVYVLWSDYFKPEHLEKYPDLHDKLWKTAKQASQVKQTVSMEEAKKLADMVHDVAHLFADSKQ
ncbi:MAG TPA: superoxide dismutase, Ni [Candidatus Saccharibacteria bacterium]|nr:superoxide dismutase, Ni [Candidatus Saccharibacteria bacterium]